MEPDSNNLSCNEPRPPPEQALLRSSTVIYLVMASIGVMVLHFVHGNLTQMFQLPEENIDLAKHLGVGLLGIGVLLSLSYFFEQYFASYRSLKHTLVLWFGPYSILSLFYLALISAIGEEILFRGAIQPTLGLIGTSVVFGLIHIGPGGKLSSWSLWAFLSGLLLGWIAQGLSSLWSPILCHFGVNLISMLQLKYKYKQLCSLTIGSSEKKDGDTTFDSKIDNRGDR